MNKKQKIVLYAAIILIAAAFIIWLLSGAEIFTKNQVQVEVYDELFDTTYMEWKDKFVLGLDYVLGFSGLVALISGILILLFKSKRKELS